MKKLLTILGGLGLTATAVSPVMAMAPVSQKATQFNVVGNQWLNIGIYDRVKPARLGNQTKEHHDTKVASSNEDWNIFANAEAVQAEGDFDYHTYWGSVENKFELLTIDKKNSTDVKKIWTFDRTNHDGNEAVYQTSEISMKLTATYDKNTKITTFSFYYSIYAHTKSAVHSMHTTISVDSLKWVQ